MAAVVLPDSVLAQSTAKQWRVAFLSAGFAGTGSWEAFRKALKELGYVEGQNLVFDARFGQGRLDTIPQLAAEIVALQPDIVVAVGVAETAAVKRLTTTTPIVMVVVPDPVGSRFVASLGRPGANVTGLTSTPAEDLQGKRLELLLELVPNVKRIGFLANTSLPATPSRVRATQKAAEMLGVEFRIIEAKTRDELSRAFAAARDLRIDGLLVPTDPLFLGQRRLLTELAAETRIPTMYDVREYVDAGGFAGYGPNFNQLFVRAAAYVDKVAKGQKPADLPVEQPTTFEFIINLKTAKRLGLTIPPSMLQRVDQVVQ